MVAEEIAEIRRLGVGPTSKPACVGRWPTSSGTIDMAESTG